MQGIFSWNQLLFRNSHKRPLQCSQTYCIYNVALSKNQLNTKVSSTNTFTKMTTTMMMMMMKPWLVWNSERKFTWPFTNYEGGNDPEFEKIQNGNRTGLTFAKTGRNDCPLSYWRAGHCDDHSYFHVFIRSSKYVISYTSIHVSELRDVMRGN